MLVFFILVSGTPPNFYAQKKESDSLNRKKIELESLPNFKETDTNYIKVLYKLARSLRYQNPDSTKILSEKVITLSESKGFKKGIAGGKLGLGIYHVLKTNFEEGFKNTDEAIELAKSVNADTIYLRALNTSAVGHFMNGDYPQTYLRCKEGESYAEKIGNVEMLNFFLTNLATCFSLLEEYDQAITYYEKSYEISLNSNDGVSLAQIQSNLGYAYLKREDYKKARKYAELALKRLENFEFDAAEAFIYRVLGEIALKEGFYDEALEHLKKSEELTTPITNWQGKAETYLAHADLYYQKNQLEKSLNYGLKAESLSQQSKFPNGIARASEILSKISKNQNRTEDALQYLLVSKHLNDSIYESRNKNRFLLLEAKSKFEESQKSMQFENEKKLARRNLYIILSISTILILTIVIFFIAKNVKNKERANQELSQLNDVKNKVFSIIGHDLKTPINTLQELLELYADDAITEKDVIKLAPRLKDNVDHSSFTLNNLLYWANTQMKGIQIIPRKILVKPVATRICELYSSQIEQKKIEINCSIDPELKAFVDPDHLEVILRNIISNAIKFSHDGGKIHFGSYEEGNKAVFDISDTGIGMNKVQLNSFLTESKINSTIGTHSEKGTGIGLQIVKQLIDLNKGKITIKSSNSDGTKVEISFPKV